MKQILSLMLHPLKRVTELQCSFQKLLLRRVSEGKTL